MMNLSQSAWQLGNSDRLGMLDEMLDENGMLDENRLGMLDELFEKSNKKWSWSFFINFLFNIFLYAENLGLQNTPKSYE